MITMHKPPYQGSVLKNVVLDGSNISVTDFAKHIGIIRVASSRVVNGTTAMSADLAIRLAQALGWIGTKLAWVAGGLR
jgi:antitoxin HigA-1